jgi:CHAT domain
MSRLLGAQRMVLQSIFDLPKDVAGFVSDHQIARNTMIAIKDVRNWIKSLEGDGFINVARTDDGLCASISAAGRLALGIYQPFQLPTESTAALTTPKRSAQPLPDLSSILILPANPKDTNPLRLDEEVKKIEQGLERSKRRDQFKLVVKWAVTDDDLRRAMLDILPEIVHFSGHSSGESQGGQGRDLVSVQAKESNGLVFEDDSGQIQLISEDSLSRLFEVCSDHVKCVVLNACYSEAQANAISQHIDYVVGMEKAIGDEAAIKFAVGFYDALGAGRDVETAFKFGCSAIDLKGIPEYLTPVLKKKP